MKQEKRYNVIEEVRKVRNRMSLKHWKNRELFQMKLDAAARRLQEQLSTAKP